MTFHQVARDTHCRNNFPLSRDPDARILRAFIRLRRECFGSRAPRISSSCTPLSLRNKWKSKSVRESGSHPKWHARHVSLSSESCVNTPVYDNIPPNANEIDRAISSRGSGNMDQVVIHFFFIFCWRWVENSEQLRKSCGAIWSTLLMDSCAPKDSL